MHQDAPEVEGGSGAKPKKFFYNPLPSLKFVVYKREKQYREEPVIDGEAQIVIVQFHKSRPRIFII